MHISEARIRTENAGRYLGQLCKHFAHKIPVEWDKTTGKVDFEPGSCRLQAAEGELVLRCESQEPQGLETVKKVMADHLLRFAWREELNVAWSDAA